MGNDVRFAWIIVCSTAVMFRLRYLNTHEIAHLHFSQTRAWMALAMGAAVEAPIADIERNGPRRPTAGVGGQ